IVTPTNLRGRIFCFALPRPSRAQQYHQRAPLAIQFADACGKFFRIKAFNNVGGIACVHDPSLPAPRSESARSALDFPAVGYGTWRRQVEASIDGTGSEVMFNR